MKGQPFISQGNEKAHGAVYQRERGISGIPPFKEEDGNRVRISSRCARIALGLLVTGYSFLMKEVGSRTD